MSIRIKKFTLLFLFLVLFLFSGAAQAQDGPSPQHSDPFWEAQYWNNATLSGEPLVTGADAAIDFNWGNGSPHASIGRDNFSARWSRYLDLEAGAYRFTAATDDGVRVYLDGELIIDRWSDHPIQTYSVERTVSAGHHRVVVEYYERTGLAEAHFRWERVPSQTIRNWRGEYFNNTSLSGSPAVVRDDASIDFNWGLSGPVLGVRRDNFSVRWTRTVSFAPGTYRFTTTTDDGVRLWVNDHLLIDKWVDQAAASHSGTIYLSGNAPIRMEYFDSRDHAVARLSWTRSDGGSTAPPPAGGVIVDNTDPGFVKGGAAASWRTQPEGYGNSLLWTKNNDRVRANYNWARWYPSLTAGRYEVFVYIPERYTTTSAARYWVSHRDGFTLRVVDQSANGDRWVSLGTYSFRGNNNDYVSLSDVTYESYLSRLIAFDAVRWVAR
ncbi:MAG TPA: PA14 domain-containing protein [Candidatus Sulfomarinibacteraceae bacterium]|nr:PA14 domain-containing protein [Candidatus Sulfomarinibacteraceae bacterium]